MECCMPGSLSFTISQNLLKLKSIESVMPPYHFNLCCLLLFLPSVFPSIRVFSSESAFHIRWPNYWTFSFSISPSNEYSGLIFFRLTGLITLQWGLSRVFSSTTVRRHQFFCAQHFLLSISHICTSVQFSCSVVSDSLWPHESQHTRPPWPSPTPRIIQTHVHGVGDAIQPSHPLLSPSLSAFSLSQHQSLFQRVSFSYQVTQILDFQLQHQSFQWIFRTDFL